MSSVATVDPVDEAERLMPMFPETAQALLRDACGSADAEVKARALAVLSLREAVARSGDGLRRARELLAGAAGCGASSALALGWVAHAGGYIAFRGFDDAEALRRLNEAARLWQGQGRLRARVFDTLGMLLARRGDLDGAFDYFSLSLDLKRTTGDRRSLAITHGNLGRLALNAERFDEAERWLRADLELVLAEAERPATVAHVRNQLALALAGQGRLAEARSELLHAVEVAPPRSIVRAYALKDLARMEISAGLSEAARQRLTEARAEVEAGGFDEARPGLRLAEAELAAGAGEGEPWAAFDEAVQGFARQQAPQQACEAALVWAAALQQRGDQAGARRVLEGAVKIAEAHLFRQENPLARVESALDEAGGSLLVLQARLRRMLGGVDERWLLEQRSGAYHARRLQGERARVTVWTCDLRGFTEFCARLDDPRRVVRMLNRFFARVGQALLDHGGCIDKYVGDSILAYFQGEDAASRACRASLDAFERLADLNAERAHLGEPELAMGVGMASGFVVEGNVGFAGKLEHTIIGTPVNAACRLVARAAGGQSLLDEATASGLPASLSLVDAGWLELKGLGQVRAFSLQAAPA